VPKTQQASIKDDIRFTGFGRRDIMLRHKRSTRTNMDSDEDTMLESSIQVFPLESDTKNEYNDSDYEMSTTSEEVFTECQSRFETKVSEMMDEDSDISENEARENVFLNMKNTYRKSIMNTFGSKVHWFNVMKKDPIFMSIKNTVNQLIETEDYQADEALKYAVLKQGFLFDKVLNNYEIPEL
jgi:hypothetical protein